MLRDERAIQVVRLVAEFMATSSTEAAIALEEYIRDITRPPFAGSPDESEDIPLDKMYTVYLNGDNTINVSGGNDKIARIREIRSLFQTPLKETKAAIEGIKPLAVCFAYHYQAKHTFEDLVNRGYRVSLK